jgi:hypothetical protein
MPHDMPHDWNVISSSVPLTLVALVLFFALLFCLFLSRERLEGQPNPVVGVIVMGVMIFVCCPLMLFALVSFISTLSFAGVELRMHQDGRLTDTGVVREKVVRKTFSEGGVAYEHHWLLIDFRDHEGERHQVEREVDQPSWNQQEPGSCLPDIEYPQSDPTTWRFAGEAGLWLRLLFRSGWMAAVVVALRFSGAFLLRRTRRST